MIRKIFLPEKIGTHRLFAERLVGIYQYEQTIYAASVQLKRHETVIEQLFEEPIIEIADQTPQDAVIAALKQLSKRLAPDSNIVVAIPAHLTIAKELEVPFCDLEKIRMVLDYEIESMLPFSLDEAIVDFIITKIADDRTSSQVMAIAVRKQDLATVLETYQLAGIAPSRISVNLFATYGLYMQITEYKNSTGSVAMVDLGIQGTRVTFLQHNQLKLTRYITRGIGYLIDLISDESTLSAAEVELRLRAQGLHHSQDQEFDKIVQKHVIALFSEIQFTLNSFSLKLGFYGDMKILFSGKAADLPGLMPFSSDLLQIPCELLDPKKLLSNQDIICQKSLVVDSWYPFAVPLGLAIQPAGQEEFNLRRKEFRLINESLATRQIIAALSLIFGLFAIIGIKGYVQISRLSSVAHALEQEQIAKIFAILPKKDRSRTAKLPMLIKKAESFFNEKHALWAPFSQQRTKPLEYLYEVTRLLDKSQFSIDFEEFTLNEKEAGNPIIELEGYFKSEKGLGFHHTEFAELEERIKASNLLEFADQPSSVPAAEKGIKFTFKLCKKGKAVDEASRSR